MKVELNHDLGPFFFCTCILRSHVCVRVGSHNRSKISIVSNYIILADDMGRSRHPTSLGLYLQTRNSGMIKTPSGSAQFQVTIVIANFLGNMIECFATVTFWNSFQLPILAFNLGISQCSPIEIKSSLIFLSFQDQIKLPACYCQVSLSNKSEIIAVVII